MLLFLVQVGTLMVSPKTWTEKRRWEPHGQPRGISERRRVRWIVSLGVYFYPQHLPDDEMLSYRSHKAAYVDEGGAGTRP